MDQSVTERIAERCAALSYTDLAPLDVDAAKRCILDYLAAATAGYRINEPFNHALYRIASMGQDRPESTVLMYGAQLSSADAAFMNGALAHGADMDDGYRTAQGHPGACVLPAVLALAQTNGAKGRDVLTAIAVGYEMYARLGTAINPYHARCGFHTTGTVGTVAAAAAAAKILHMDAQKTLNSICLGCMQAAGLLEVVEHGQQAKPLNTARAAQAGVMSALWAQAGAVAPETALDGNQGFLNAFSENRAQAIRDLSAFGDPLLVSNGYFKPYPSCRHTHGAIDLAIALRSENEFSIENIESVTVFLYGHGIRVTGNIVEPRNAEEAKFCLRYTIGVALACGSFSLQHLDVENTLTPQIRRLMKLVQIERDDVLEDKQLGIRGARIRISMKNGHVFEDRVMRPRGENPNPLTWEELTAKLSECAGRRLTSEQQRHIVSLVREMEQLQVIDPLLAWMKDSEIDESKRSVPDADKRKSLR